jgi:hypothetical protein
MSAGVNAAMKKYHGDDILFIEDDSDNEEDNVVLVMKDSSEDSDDGEDDEEDEEDEDDQEDEGDEDDEDEAERFVDEYDSRREETLSYILGVCDIIFSDNAKLGIVSKNN